jgi:hypothetical protein
MSARPALCGGYRVSGIPTAIADYAHSAALALATLFWLEEAITKLPKRLVVSPSLERTVSRVSR